METEIKLVVIGSVSEGQVYSLVEKCCDEWRWCSDVEQHIIVDTYYDTRNYDLRKRKYGLRTRVSGSNQLVTLKGPAIFTNSGALQREEFESVFDLEFAKVLFAKIKLIGMHASELPRHGNKVVNFFSSLGLAPVQVRQTQREIRKLCQKDSPAPLAEFSIDTVQYEIGKLKVVHKEIEVELLKGCSFDDFEYLIGVLKRTLSVVSRVWSVDKLALGFFLEEYSRKGLLERHISDYGRLDEKLYKTIEEMFSDKLNQGPGGLF